MRYRNKSTPITLQRGGGFFDKLKNIGKKISDFSSGEIGTAISNAIPDSDSNARPLFVGEQHALLKLPNGKMARANFMGPGTHIVERLRRGDPPRTLSDKTAKAHDIRYLLSKNPDDVRKADNKMIDSLNRLQRMKLDSDFNINQGRLIQAKTIGEDIGFLKKGSFADFKQLDNDNDRNLVNSELNKLEIQGYGKKSKDKDPAYYLRKVLLKQAKKNKKK